MLDFRVLIVEADAIIANDLADELESRGIFSLQIVGCMRDALRAIGRNMPKFAIVDLHLRDGATGAALVRALVKSGVQVCVLSGQQRPDATLMVINHTFIAKPAPASVVAEIVAAYARKVRLNLLDSTDSACIVQASLVSKHAASLLAI